MFRAKRTYKITSVIGFSYQIGFSSNQKQTTIEILGFS